MKRPIIAPEIILRTYIENELATFSDDNFAQIQGRLGGEGIRKLACKLSRIRGNGLWEILQNPQIEWTEYLADASLLTLSEMESETDPILQACDFQLLRVAKHSGIDQLSWYQEAQKDKTALEDTLYLAVENGEKYIIRDGNHRAIVACKLGITTLRLAVPNDPEISTSSR